MTATDIERLDEAKAFSATWSFEALERFHVPFDDLMGTDATEARLATQVRQRRRVAIRAASGEGKSSVIASVLGPLALDRDAKVFPVRIPVAGAAGDTVVNTQAFFEMVLHSILRWSDRGALGRRDQRKFDKIEGDLRERQETRRAGLTIPLWFLQPDLAREVTTTISAITDYSDALGQTRRVAELLRSAEKELVLVFDDTDAWLQSIELDRHELAAGFFSGPFRALVKDLDVGVVIAVHRAYGDVPEYRTASELLDTTIDIPRFDGGATEAFTSILDRRVHVELGGKISLSEVIDEDAISAVARFYQAAGGHSLRATLRTANTALEHARRNAASVITSSMVEQAIAEELG